MVWLTSLSGAVLVELMLGSPCHTARLKGLTALVILGGVVPCAEGTVVHVGNLAYRNGKVRGLSGRSGNE